jgi:D-alanyl-D-alanine carboxypeptidase/D-alanyl-D-alanine-endopeptidase (penicillin-binding protein 4)
MNHLKRTCEYSVVVLIFITLVSCASQKERHLRKNISKVLELGHFEDHFTGIMLFDPVSNDTLLALNSDRYFTPASNTKIFTLYSALKILPEQLPALSYVIQNDTLYFQGTGDAAALHPFFKDSTAALFLKRYPNIAYVPGNFQDDKFGPGWAW